MAGAITCCHNGILVEIIIIVYSYKIIHKQGYYIQAYTLDESNLGKTFTYLYFNKTKQYAFVKVMWQDMNRNIVFLTF